MPIGKMDRTPSQRETDQAAQIKSVAPRIDLLATRETALWRLALVILVVLAVGFAVISWGQVRTFADGRRALPIGLVVLVVLFVAYALAKTREMSELRGLVRGLETRATAPPDVGQLEKLFDMVQRSQQGYRDLIDTFEDLLFSISLSGDILAANRSVAELLGHPFATLVGKPLDEFVEMGEGAGRAAALRALPRFLENRHWTGVVRARIKPDTSTRYFQCTLHALLRDGREVGICVLARDITRLRENEARFTELFETLQEGVYLATADGKFEDINPALARMLGYEKREELLDRPLSEFLLLPEEWEAEQRELAFSDAINGHEVTLRRRDGSAVTCLHAAARIRDSAGRIRRHQGTLVDITERREIERRLHREQEFARRLVESFPDLVIAADREGRYSFVSPRSKELLGFTPEEMIGMSLGARMDQRDRKEVRVLFDCLLAGRANEGSIEFLTERKDGEMRLFRATASPLLDNAGHIEGVIASARDITEAKRMEQQLIQTERLAAMGQMIAGVAHELNNPLTAVLGVTELLRDSQVDSGMRRQLELAHRQARRAAQIVQSLLSFSRPPQPRKSCVHLSDLIQRSLQLHEHSLRTNRIVVDFVPKPGLPAVLGDASQLTQVFLNLIANAEQAIREFRDHGTLRIRIGNLGDRVLATFQDDGIGIRREILPKLFDPFFTTKRPGRGTGLGLSICLAILREHNGQIEAQPLADGGSVFTVSLPIAQGTDLFLLDAPAPAVNVEYIPPDPSASAASSRLNGCSVLVVDDEESIRELVRDGLVLRGMDVAVAATAEEAISLVDRRTYDVVLCDLNLRGTSAADPSLSSRGLHARVAAQTASGAQKPLFLFMTGELVSNGSIDDLPVAGTRTLQKPFRISELITILTDALVSIPVRSPTH
jgi:PAS domain S-box-containing protein